MAAYFAGRFLRDTVGFAPNFIPIAMKFKNKLHPKTGIPFSL